MLQRYSILIKDITVAAAVADSTEILVSEFSMGMIFVPTDITDGGADQTITSITWHASDEAGGTYLPVTDEFASAVVQTVAKTNSYQLPSALAGAVVIKGVGDAAGRIHLAMKG